jgi:hypothetical protein
MDYITLIFVDADNIFTLGRVSVLFFYLFSRKQIRFEIIAFLVVAHRRMVCYGRFTTAGHIFKGQNVMVYSRTYWPANMGPIRSPKRR